MVSCRVVSCRVVSCRVVSCRVVSCRVVSCRVVSSKHALPQPYLSSLFTIVCKIITGDIRDLIYIDSIIIVIFRIFFREYIFYIAEYLRVAFCGLYW